MFSVTSYALRVLLLSVVPGLGSSPARPQLRGFVGHRLEIPAALLALEKARREVLGERDHDA